LSVFLENNPETQDLSKEENDFKKLAAFLQETFKDSHISFKPVQPLNDKPIREPLTTHGFIVFKKRSHEWEVPVEFFWSEKTNQLREQLTKLRELQQKTVTLKVIDKERTLEALGILQLINAIQEISKPYMNIQRYKGLGEMNPKELWDTTMDPETRKFLQINIEEAREADKIFDVLMGKEVPLRKKFIQSYADKVQNLDV